MTEYGVFNAEGCIERGFNAHSLAQLTANRWSEDDESVYAAEMCPDHDEEPRDTCEGCATDGVEPDIDEDAEEL